MGPTVFGGVTGLCLLWLLLFSPAALSDYDENCPQCHPKDREVLLRIKKELNNPYLLSSWDPNDKDCTGWYGIECDPETHRINSLALQYSGPEDTNFWQIPPSVGDLPYLEDLIFHKLPSLIGPIQPTIAKLTKLKFLRIDYTNVSGPVPPFLTQLKHLEYLRMDNNNLSGPLPSYLSQLPNLTYVQLDHNKFTGPIPDSFGYFTPGTYLILSHNQLSGTIPASLGNLDAVTIDLSRNMLEGDASVLFGRNKRTQTLIISRNNFSFDLSKVEFPKKSLVELDLCHNKIYGKIPVGLTAEENLQQFNVSYNRLCGEIPQGGELQKRFTAYEFFHNKCLCGKPLPPCK